MQIHFEGDLRVVTFRQSWSDTAALCLDRARQDRGRDRSIETEATALGTGLHAGIAAALTGELDNPKHLLERAVTEFDSIEKEFLDETRDQCIAHLERWIGHLRDVPDFMVAYRSEDKMVETSFTIPVATRNDAWANTRMNGITRMDWSGTWDVLLPHCYQIDWKSAGRPYQPWERQRWAKQPTFYTEAARQMGLLPRPSLFRYVVFPKRDKPVQTIDVYRDERFTRHEIRNLWRIVDLHDALPDGPWPINDQHALCSAKWCPYWDDCKGRDVPVDFMKKEN